MSIKQLGNVTQLSAYRAPTPVAQTKLTDRQLAVREHFQDVLDLSAEQSATAYIGLAVQPDGRINSIALQVEPEHVIPVLAAMRVVMTNLESYLTSSLAGRHLMLFGAWLALQVVDIAAVPAMATAAFSLIK